MANEGNLRSINSLATDVQREIRSKGGKARAKKIRECKTIADALRKVLDEPTEKGSKITKRDAVVAKVVKNLFDKPSAKGLKIVAEILGELKQTISTEGDGLTIIVKSQEEKDKLDNIGGLDI